jgi:hypothetical protein
MNDTIKSGMASGLNGIGAKTSIGAVTVAQSIIYRSVLISMGELKLSLRWIGQLPMPQDAG